MSAARHGVSGQHHRRLQQLARLLWWGPLLLGLCLQWLAGPARAQDDPPGRVGRLAHLQGPVSWYDHEEGRWVDADRNRPLTTGDRVATGSNAQAELRVGSTVLRLAAATELEVLRLDDERMAWQLHSGSVAVRLRTRDAAQETELVTGEVRLLPERAGHYRIDRIDDTTWAAAWRGSLRGAHPENPVVVEGGQRLELWRESARWQGAATAAPLRQRAGRVLDDEFSAWVLAEDRQDERSTAHRYVSPEMTGVEDLDRHGRWEQHPEYGALWLPTVVAADWAPYRQGRWAWVQPWGWTWVDDARWGFAPFHYGRWVNWRGRWAWYPGAYVARPVYAPALVAWVGGPRLNVSVSIGLPSVAWVPLAPREVFVPHYRHSPVYVGRVNPRLPSYGPEPRNPPPHQSGVPTWKQPVQQAGPVVYSNQGVPGAVTVVPRDVLLQRQPVGRAVVDEQRNPQRPEWRTQAPNWQAVEPPAPERRARPGGEPAPAAMGPFLPQPTQPVQPALPAQPAPVAPTPGAPTLGAPTAEPSVPVNGGRPPERRPGERRGGERPAWNDTAPVRVGPSAPGTAAAPAAPAAPVGPAAPAAPMRPAAPSGAATPAVPQAPAFSGPPAPAAVQPPAALPQPAAAVAPPAVGRVGPPAPATMPPAPPAPAVRADTPARAGPERPGPARPAAEAAAPEKPASEKPAPANRATAEEGRKRVPDARGQSREALN